MSKAKLRLDTPVQNQADYIDRGLSRCNGVISMFAEQDDFENAIEAYQKAIANYPPTAKFYLNEVYNNLGSAWYSLGDIEKAKQAWEKALAYSPSDKMARTNLAEFFEITTQASKYFEKSISEK